MSPEESFELFSALKLHFNSKDYDFHKYNGKVKHKLKQTNKHYWFYNKLGEMSEEDCLGFILANILVNKNLFIKDLFTREAKDEYEFWKYRVEHKYNILLKELKLIQTKNEKKFNSLKNILFLDHDQGLDNTEKDEITSFFYKKDLTLESLVLLNSQCNFISFNDEEDTNNIVFDLLKFNLEKYSPFISCDSEKILRILKISNYM